MSNQDKLFITDEDLEFLNLLARGHDVQGIVDKTGRSSTVIYTRLKNLQYLFRATTLIHLVAICISSDIIRCNDLYNDDLAGDLYVKGVGSLGDYHLRTLREQVLEGQIKWWFAPAEFEKFDHKSPPIKRKEIV